MKCKYIVNNFLLYLVIVHCFSDFFSDTTTGMVGDFIELIDPRELIESTDYCTIWLISGLASFLGHNNSTVKASFCYCRCFLALQVSRGCRKNDIIFYSVSHFNHVYRYGRNMPACMLMGYR